MADNTTQTTGSNESEKNRQYVILYEGRSLTDMAGLGIEDSLSSALARSRGRGTTVNVAETQPPWEDDKSSEESVHDLRVTQGALKSQTGVFMSFVDRKYTELSCMDVMALPSVPSYPAPEPVVDNLPFQIRKELEDKGYVQCTGIYSQSESRFYSLTPGWETKNVADRDDVERLIELMDNVGLTAVQAVDKIFDERGSLDPREVARMRGVKPESVQRNIKRAEQRLNDRS